MSETIVVTGATRGLGRAMAEGFAARGHRVVGCGRSDEAIAKLRDGFPGPHRFDVVDVTDDATVAAWARDVLDTHGPPDRLVNNAAIMTATMPLWEVPAEEMSRILEVNVAGTVNVIRHFVPAMIGRGRGVIVNFSSGWGRSVSPDVAPYCATKWAIEGLTRALALELPEGLAAVPFNPGIIDTDMLRVGFGDDAGSYPRPAEWAEAAVPFLLALGARDNGRPASSP